MRRTTVLVLALLVLIAVAVLAPAEGPAQDAAPAVDPGEDEALEEYVPSQKVSLDSSISFPVDI